jgi:hypothetical protein
MDGKVGFTYFCPIVCSRLSHDAEPLKKILSLSIYEMLLRGVH